VTGDLLVSANLPGVDPGANRIEERSRFATVKLDEHVSSVFRSAGPHDLAIFIDPNDCGHIDQAVAVSDDVLGVDQAGMLGIGLFDVGACSLS